MTLREFKQHLDNFYNSNPEARELEVIYSSDSEGNSYDSVHYSPTLMTMGSDGYPVAEEDLVEVYESGLKIIEKVCIN